MALFYFAIDLQLTDNVPPLRVRAWRGMRCQIWQEPHCMSIRYKHYIRARYSLIDDDAEEAGPIQTMAGFWPQKAGTAFG